MLQLNLRLLSLCQVFLWLLWLFWFLGKKLLPFTGVGIYPPDPSAEYTECSPVQQFDFFSKLTTEWEKAANLEPQAKNDCRVITIRSGVVLGKLTLQLT